jgi:type IV pilus assembly protein PilQ
VTRVFPISYANLATLTNLLSQFGNFRGGSTGTTASTIQSDERTNSVIVQDLPENIDRMKKLIDILDTQTPQVLIEGKIVDASERFAKNLQGQFAALGSSDRYFSAFNGASTDTLLGSTGVATGPVGGASFGFSPNLTYIPGLARLNALLSLSETETETKVIQSPRLVVRSGAKAEIADSRPVAVPAPPSGGLGSSIQQFTIEEATLGLSVTPTVANDGNVKLLIEMTRGAAEAAGGGLSGVAEKKLTTEVYVESGSTLVIGGIYSMSDQTETGGFPILRKIPILGALFGGETRSTSRNELFIFITPRILNEKESLLSGDTGGSAG